MKIPKEVVLKVDYLRAVTEFKPSHDQCYTLKPAAEWGRSVAPLQEIVKFFQDKEGYSPPNDYKLVFEAFCLGHFLTVFEFTTALCQFFWSG